MNLPNQLTIARILAIFFCMALANIQPIFPRFYPLLEISQETVLLMHRIAYALAILAAFTDLLDGYIARKYNCVTDFGTLMDPLADKIFVTVTFLVFVEYRLIPAWIAITILSREFLVTGLRSLAARKSIIIPADKWGKLKTALQMTILAVGGASWVKLIPVNLAETAAPYDIYRYIWQGSLWTITLITIGSGLGYFIRYRHLFKEDKKII